MSREIYYGALFSLLSSLKADNTVRICDRRVRLLDEMEVAELPALFMSVGHQDVKQVKGFPPKRLYRATGFLYACNPDRHTAAGIQLNGLIDAVERVLAPDPMFGVQTLGGKVEHAWIEGSIQIFEGPQGERAAAILPINMLIP